MRSFLQRFFLHLPMSCYYLLKEICSILTRILFGLLFWALRFVVSYAMKKEAMGSADIFIAAIIGAIYQLGLLLVAIYLAALLTLPVYMIVRKKGYELAFVPFLSPWGCLSPTL